MQKCREFIFSKVQATERRQAEERTREDDEVEERHRTLFIETDKPE